MMMERIQSLEGKPDAAGEGSSSCSAVLKKIEGRPWIGQLINHSRKEMDVDRDTSSHSL